MALGSLSFNLVVFPGFFFAAVAGLVTSWIIRKVSALVQWRVGPPLLQPFYDVVKLFGKELVIPEGAAEWVFLGIPLLGPAGLTLSSMILMKSNYGEMAFVGDVIVVLYLLLIPALAVVIGGFASGNPLSAVGSNRELKLVLSFELPLVLSVVTAIVKSGGSLTLTSLSESWVAGSLSGSLAFLVALICVQAELGFRPFDISEAETEVMGGPLIEYSGPPLGLFKLSHFMALFALPLLLVTLFLSGFRGGLGILWGVLKFLLVVVLIALIENTNPRMRSDQALKVFWFLLTPVSVLSVVLAVVGSTFGLSWL